MVAADSVFTNAALPRCRSAAHSDGAILKIPFS